MHTILCVEFNYGTLPVITFETSSIYVMFISIKEQRRAALWFGVGVVNVKILT